jgi:hypothetical protein
MKIENILTFGWENAIRGMRYPKDSERKMDSVFNPLDLGQNDLRLALSLIKAGSEHRKFLRMIHVQSSLLMPISWWIQFDTYKVGTVANSRSRMHKFGFRKLTLNDFYEVDILNKALLEEILKYLNDCIFEYMNSPNAEKRRAMWKSALDLLPMSYQQERMLDFNYETMITIFKQRKIDKLSKEWNFFISAYFDNCPYFQEFCEALNN